MTVGPGDLDALPAGDPEGMLLAVASSGAQVRQAAGVTAAAGLSALVADGRPRALLVCGMGASATAGDVLAAVAGLGCPVPIMSHRGYGLPGWAGVADLVVAVSCSGRTPETLSALEEAVRRGCRLLVVGAAGSPLEELAARGRGVFVPVPPGRAPRASLWSLAVPMVVAADRLGLLPAGAAELEEAATTLEQVAVRCRPDADVGFNPAKTLAQDLDGALPVIWGASPLTAAAAYRLACQLNENAAVPATWGVLPEAAHTQVAVWDGSWSSGPLAEADLFRDREDELVRPVLRVVLLRDPDEHPEVRRCAEATTELARERGIGVSSLLAEGGCALARLASLVCLTDFASTYLALLGGIDPTSGRAAAELQGRMGP